MSKPGIPKHYYPTIMEIITIYSVLSNMTTKAVMKEKFLGILLHSTVKKLTEEKRNEEAPSKQNKNGGIGIKNSRLKGHIHKFWTNWLQKMRVVV